MTGASLALSVAILAGRLSGFAREIQLAALLGLSREADLAVLILTLPDLLVNILLSGGLSVALIPVFRTATPERASALLLRWGGLVLVVFSIVALVLCASPKAFLAFIAPGMSHAATAGYSSTFRIGAAALPLAALSGVSTAFLNARDRFFVAGAGTLIFNATLIAGIFVFARWLTPLDAVACAVVAAALLRLASQVFALPRDAWRPAPATEAFTLGLFARFVTAFSASALTMLVPVLVRALASFAGDGAIASFNFATKLVELPVGVAITTVATVAYPRLCESHAQGRLGTLTADYSTAMTRAITIAVCVLLPALWFGDSMVFVFFRHGAVDEAAARQLVALTRIGMLSLPFVAVSSMATAGLNAVERTGAVFRVTLACLLALPVLAIPGILRREPHLLMLGLVGFHASLAAALLVVSRLPARGLSGWCTGSLARSLGGALVVGVAFVMLDVLARGTSWVRIVELVACAGAMAAVALTLQHRSSATLSGATREATP